MTDQPPPPPPAVDAAQKRRGPPRRRVLIAGVLIVAIAAGAVASVVILTRHSAVPSAATAANASGVSSEDQLLAQIRDHGLTPLRAEELFALDIGPLPGVSVVGIKPNHGFDGSTALEAVYGEWSRISPAVQAAVNSLLRAPSSFSAAPAPVTATPSASVTPMRAQPSTVATGIQLMDTVQTYFESLASTADQAEAAATGTSPVTFTVFVHDMYPPNPDLYAEAGFSGTYALQQGGCHIHVYDPRFNGLDQNTAAGIIAHEMFHCFQYRVAGTADRANSVSQWLVEGEPTWVMETLYPGSSSPVHAWTKYAESPLTVFSDRSYDALGVYGHLGDLAGASAPWTLLLPVYATGIGHKDLAAFNQLISGHSQHYFDAWGPSYYEQQAPADWRMLSPGTPPASGPFASTSVTVAADQTEDLATAAQYQARDVLIQGSADIVLVVMASGYGEIHDNGNKVDQTLSDTAPIALCLRSGGCKCPDGSPGASEHTVQAMIPVSLGFDGGDKGLASYAAGESIDKYCKQPDPPGPPSSSQPPPGGGGGGGGGPESPPQQTGRSIGDPHFTTFDGRLYDMQATGEFTLIKSTRDDFTVQARAQPLPKAPVAVNTAVATMLEGHRLTLTLENGDLVLRIDGSVSDYVQQSIGGGSADRDSSMAGTGWVLEWPDGTRVRVSQMGIYGLNISIALAPGRRGTLTGLLGDGSSSPQSFMTSTGQSLGNAPTAQVIHGSFAASWRITQQQSLFDYQPGQSTATFTDLSFPSDYVNAGTIQGAAASHQACVAEGITDPYLLADCTVDSAAIPDHTPLTIYAQAQVVQTVQYNLAHHLPVFAPPQAGGGTGPATTPTPNLQGVVVDSGTINSPQETQTFAFPGQAGEIIWIGKPGCMDNGVVFALVDPNGKTLNANAVSLGESGCDVGLGRFVLADTGTYQLIANADHTTARSYGLPIRMEPPDNVRPVSYGQTVSGSIPDAAAHDVYTLQAHAGDHISLGGGGCATGPSNNPIGVVIVSTHDIPAQGGVAAHKDQTSVDCGGASLQLQLTDTYQIIVNWANDGPFDYQFQLLRE